MGMRRRRAICGLVADGTAPWGEGVGEGMRLGIRLVDLCCSWQRMSGLQFRGIAEAEVNIVPEVDTGTDAD